MDKMTSEKYRTAILEQTGLSYEEIDKLAQQKVEELKGLISIEGALFIVAREVGADLPQKSNAFDSFEAFKIGEVTERGMKNLTLNGRILRIYELKTFIKKDGSEGKVLNFLLCDNTSRIRLVVWDDLTDILKNPEFKVNALIQITHGYSKFSDYHNKVEVNLGWLSRIIFNPTGVDPKNYDEIEVLGDDW